MGRQWCSLRSGREDVSTAAWPPLFATRASQPAGRQACSTTATTQPSSTALSSLHRYHEAGNIGVEHAAPAAIRAALAALRRSDPGRQAFSRDDLLAAGLVAELHARVSGLGLGALHRRCLPGWCRPPKQSCTTTTHCWPGKPPPCSTSQIMNRQIGALPSPAIQPDACHPHHLRAGRGRDGTAIPGGRLPGAGSLRWQAAAAPAQPLLLHAGGAAGGTGVGGAAAGSRRGCSHGGGGLTLHTLCASMHCTQALHLSAKVQLMCVARIGLSFQRIYVSSCEGVG